jgi:hypothetical protein
MFIRRTVIAAALIAVPLSFAAPAQATCSDGYFGADESTLESQGICGVPDLAGTFGQVRTNLANNFSPQVAAGHLQGNLDPGTAAGHLQGNLDPGTAAGNLEHAITHGVGEKDQNAPNTP